jgi:hypothetical protein
MTDGSGGPGRLLLAGVVVVVVSAAVIVGVVVLGGDEDDGEVARADLAAGDCIEHEADVEQADVATVDCADPHVYEVIGTFAVEGADAFPGEDNLVVQGQEGCFGTIFDDYVGLPFVESALHVTPLTPTAPTWSDGDRTVVCLAHEEDLSPIEGSVENSAR